MNGILAFIQALLSGVVTILNSFRLVPQLIRDSYGLLPPELYAFLIGACVIILCIRIIELLP